jgi:hypothetical protein
MPLFPDESPFTLEEEGTFGRDPLESFQEQTGVRRDQVRLSVVPVHLDGTTGRLHDYIVARPTLAGTNLPDPNLWWVLDTDTDDAHAWASQATFDEAGFIVYPEPESTETLPRGNTSVRDALRAGLTADDEGDVIASPFLQRAHGRLSRSSDFDDPDPPAPEARVVYDISGNPIPEVPKPTRTAYDYLNASRPPKPPKSVWDRLVEQRERPPEAAEAKPEPVAEKAKEPDSNLLPLAFEKK